MTLTTTTKKNTPMLRMHNVAIQTGNFQRAYHFYAEILCLPVVREPFEFKGQRMMAWFDAGSVLLELYSVKYGVTSAAYDPHQVGPVHIAFEVEDLDEVIAWLDKSGLQPTTPPYLPPSGDPRQPRVVFFIGPEGEELQFREPAAG